MTPRRGGTWATGAESDGATDSHGFHSYRVVGALVSLWRGFRCPHDWRNAALGQSGAMDQARAVRSRHQKAVARCAVTVVVRTSCLWDRALVGLCAGLLDHD